MRARGMWLLRRAGRRGSFLAFLTILNFLYGYSLLKAPRSQQVVDLLLPWHVWGWLWTAMGVVTASGIFVRKDRVQFTAAAAFKSAWAAVWVDAWISHGVADAWISAVIWGAFAGIVLVIAGWPEPVLPPVPGEMIMPGGGDEH